MLEIHLFFICKFSNFTRLFDIQRMGLICARLKNEQRAIDYFINSLILFPWNWSAFKELLCFNLSPENLGIIKEKLSSSICFSFFITQYSIDHSHSSAEITENLTKLRNYFPNHPDIALFYALHHYHIRGKFQSQKAF